jgi:hypothetical protein
LINPIISNEGKLKMISDNDQKIIDDMKRQLAIETGSDKSKMHVFVDTKSSLNDIDNCPPITN